MEDTVVAPLGPSDHNVDNITFRWESNKEPVKFRFQYDNTNFEKMRSMVDIESQKISVENNCKDNMGMLNTWKKNKRMSRSNAVMWEINGSKCLLTGKHTLRKNHRLWKDSRRKMDRCMSSTADAPTNLDA